MRKKRAGRAQVPKIRETDAERLLYVRRIVDQWIARIAIPKPARRKLVAKRVVAIRHQLSDHTPQEKGTRYQEHTCIEFEPRRRTRPRSCGSCWTK
jgi:hypothetical protein